MRATQPSFTISCKHPHPGVVSALLTYDEPYKRPRSPFQLPTSLAVVPERQERFPSATAPSVILQTCTRMRDGAGLQLV